MPRLAVANTAQVERILLESHSLWGGGLSTDDYLAFWHELSETEWARSFVTYHVWLGSSDEVLSSFKLYRPRIRFLGRTGRASILGAVFTPRPYRRRGHARDMIRAALREGRERGDDPALLFSDIGTRLYGRLGFRRLPADEIWGPLAAVPAPPTGWRLREVNGNDIEIVRRFHDSWCERRAIAILRDAAHWDFLLVRVRGFFARLASPGIVARFRVALRDDEPVGYLITVEGHGEWGVREVGAIGGDPRVAAAVLRAGAAEARRMRLKRLHGWLPAEVTEHLEGWRPRREFRRRAIPMVLPLQEPVDLSALDTPDATFFPYQDQF